MTRANRSAPEMQRHLDATGRLVEVGDRVESTSMLRGDKVLTGTVAELVHKNVIDVDLDRGEAGADGIVVKRLRSAAFLWRKA